jgi:uroporphyrinogen III methyltransferase/synthase
MAPTTPGTVYLVGAGPGDPGLLTLRALECLRAADYVIYDKLVSDRVLAHLPEAAGRACVSDLGGRHPEHMPYVHRAMIEQAKAGKVVVRLKGGDPLLFGRGAEEADSLRAAGVPYEIVPGVTSAMAAGAYAEIPVTHRGAASAVAFVTGHENPLKAASDLDWAALARFPGTLVLYMAVSKIQAIVRVLLDHGKAPDTPAATVELASRGEQRTVLCTLATLPATVRDQAVQAPAIVMIGKVIDLRPASSWFERKPLYNRRVLVTRPRHQAAPMLRQLELLGAVPYLLPAVDVSPPEDWAGADAAIARLAEFDWLVFTSVNGVSAFLDRLRQKGRDLRALGGVKLAAIGPATAEALRERGLGPDLVPAAYDSDHLAAELLPAARGRRVLLARADRGSDVLRQVLGPEAHVEQVVVYAQRDSVAPDAEVWEALRVGTVEFVTLTSSNIARAFLEACDEPTRARVRAGTVRLVTISPKTSAAVRALGYPVAAEAADYTIDGVVQALVELAGARTRD